MADKVTTSSHRIVSSTGTHLLTTKSPRENTSRTGVIGRTGAHEAPKGIGNSKTGSFTATRLSTGITVALGMSPSGLHEAVKPEKPAKPKMSPVKKIRIYFITVLLIALMIIAAAFSLNATSKSAKYSNYLELAYSQYEAGEYDAALTNLRKAVSITKSDESYVLMAKCYEQQQNYDKAIEVLRSLNTSDKNVQSFISELQNSKDEMLTADMINICGMQFAPDTASVTIEGMGLGNSLMSDLTQLYGLTALSVSGNAISDITAIANLGGLVSVNLSNNSVRDISALSGLTSLRNLNLDNNPVSDFTPLYGLTELAALSITGVEISAEDLAELSAALPQCAIQSDAGENENADITIGGVTFGSDVTTVDLSGLGISDISVLSACTQLKEINLDGNNVADISPLMDIPGLEKLSISGNAVTDLRPLIALTSIEYLDVSDNNVNSLVAIGSMTSLKTLYLGGNEIFDFSGLSKLGVLEVLGLEKTGITDEQLPELYSLTSLKILILEDNEGISGEGYDELTKELRGCQIKHSNLVYSVDFCGEILRRDITELTITGKGITDISGLSSFEFITSMNLSGNNISNIYILEYIKSPVEWLDLSSNNIGDATAISTMHTLKYLDLSYNSISSVNPFMMMTGLEYINLTGNKLTQEQIASLNNALPNCEIIF